MSKSIRIFRDKLTENICKDLEKLFEQAYSVNEYESSITGLCERIIEHLLKVLLFGKNINPSDKWIQEVNVWLKKISLIKTKPNNKPVPFNKLIKWGSDSLTNRENSYDIVNYENCIDNVLIEYDDLNPIGKDITFNNFDLFIKLYSDLLKACSNNTYSKDLLIDKLNQWFKKFDETYK